jgi:hypothetical protein
MNFALSVVKTISGITPIKLAARNFRGNGILTDVLHCPGVFASVSNKTAEELSN